MELAVMKRYSKSLGEFYFGSVREHAWEDVVEDLAPILYAKGLVDNQRHQRTMMDSG